MEQHEANATSYLKKHSIPALVENMTAALVYSRPGWIVSSTRAGGNLRVLSQRGYCINMMIPYKISAHCSLMPTCVEDPRAFLVSYIQQLQAAQASGNKDYPSHALLTDVNISAVFSALDLTHSGSITLSQYNNGNQIAFTRASSLSPTRHALARGRVLQRHAGRSRE